jgi:hypothetical protein
MIRQLSKFPPGTKVTITDGYRCNCYAGEFEIKEFEGTVDIGVGGMDER